MDINKKSYYTKQLKSPVLGKFEFRYIYFLLYFYFLGFAMLFTPELGLNGSEVARVPNQIIVKYKDPSFSPLATSTNAPSATVSPDVSPSFKYTALYPGQIDVVIIEGENIQLLLEELKIDPNVEYVEPNYIMQVHGITFERSDLPDDTDFGKQWALESSSSASGTDIDFLNAQALSRKSTPDGPVIIGIADSTFDIQHQDLMNQLWVNEEEIPNNGIDDDGNGYVDDIHGFDFANSSPNVNGEDDHGSHVAGICAAEKNNLRGICGAFPNVKFIALACSIGEDNLSVIALLQSIDYIIQLKNRGYNIVAINASFGSNIYSQLGYEAVENLSDHGIILCTAAGNDGCNLDLEEDLNRNGFLDAEEDLNGNGILDVVYPNNFDLPNIISVASINNNRELASYSNYGLKEVDLVAPGVDIYSTINRIDPNNIQYDYKSGTSMATPFVTAAVAFAAHNFPNETMGQRRARVLSNVVTLSSLSDKVVTGGVLNLRKIVDTDEDNLPDWWEMDHFNTLNYNKSQDNDNDGYSNQEEFLNKTNPILASDTPDFKNRLSLNNLQITDSTLEFNFTANQGYQYTIESTDSFGNSWQNQATYNGDGNPMKATITNFKTEDRSQTFYRLKATEQ